MRGLGSIHSGVGWARLEVVYRRESSSDSVRSTVNSAREGRGRGEKREEEREKERKRRKKEEREKKMLFEFSKLEFIPFSYFRIEISFLPNFDRVFYF